MIAKILKATGSLVGVGRSIVTAPGRFAISAIKGVYNKLTVPFDVYSKSDMSTPKLLARLILSGQYFSKTTGKVIKVV